MDARKLSNFMVIKSFSDNEKSLLDCLMPFVEYGLAKYRQEYIQVTDLKSYIKKECLIDIPLNTIKTLLKRLKKEGRITDYENCTIIRCVDNYVRKSNQYEESMMTFSRQTNQLVERCREYCSFDMDMDKVSMLIYEFIKSYQLILDIYNGNTDGNPSEESNPEYKKLVLYVKYISDELKTTTDNTDIRNLVHICPAKYWPQVEPSVRIRTEAILYTDFSKGSYDESTQKCGDCGALATWITETHLDNFGELEKWTRQAVEMLESENVNAVSYIETYFWSKICHANKPNITWPLKRYFKNGLKNKNQKIVQKLETQIIWEEDHPWWDVFKEELKEYPEIKYEEFPF